MQIFLNVAEKKPQSLIDHLPRIKLCADRFPNTLCLAAKVISLVGKLSKDRAEDALNFVLEHLQKADRGSQGTLLKEATLLCSSYPVLFTEKMLEEVRQVGIANEEKNSNSNSDSSNNNCNADSSSPNKNGRHNENDKENDNINNNNNNNNIHKNSNDSDESQVNQTSGNVTIVKLGGGGGSNQGIKEPEKLNDNIRCGVIRPRSTVRLDNSVPHRSMTRLNVGGSRAGSVGGLHKSMTKLNSSQQINLLTNIKPLAAISIPMKQYKIISGGVTVTTSVGNSSPTKSIM